MFLDDELLNLCNETELKTSEDAAQLQKELFRKCEDYYKTNIAQYSQTNESLKALLDKTFKLYDSFVRMLEKQTDSKSQILVCTFKTYTFKDAFFESTKLTEVYEKLEK